MSRRSPPEGIEEVIHLRPGWPEACRELLGVRQYPIDGLVQKLPDAVLRFIIVEELPGWPDAFAELFIERYGGVVKAAVTRFSPQALGLEKRAPAEEEKPSDLSDGKDWWADFYGELLLYLRGKNGGWKYLRSWDGSRPFAPWLYTVIRRRCARIAERQDQERGRTVSLDELYRTPEGDEIRWGELLADSEWEDEEERLLWQTLLPLLEQALRRLDPRSQQLLYHSYWVGFSDEEIASIFGRARETVNRKKQEVLRRLLYQMAGPYVKRLEEPMRTIVQRYYGDGQGDGRIAKELHRSPEEIERLRIEAMQQLGRMGMTEATGR